MGGTKRTVFPLICAVAGSCVEGTLDQYSQKAGKQVSQSRNPGRKQGV